MTIQVQGGSRLPESSRTTVELVSQILGKTLEEVDLGIFLSTANALITKVSECAGTKLDEATLSLMEAWVVAHFYSAANPGVTSKSVNGVSKSFHRASLGTGMETTPYGQQALLLDSSGCLERLTGQTVQFEWMGSNEQDYDTEWNR